MARRAVALFVLLAALYSLSAGLRASRGAAITGDEPFYLLTTQSLLEDGDLDLRQQYRRHSYRAFFDHPDGLWMQSVPTADGRILSPHNPGLPVLLIPGFALGGLRGAQLQLQLLAALTFALVYVWVARVTGEARWSAWATLALALAATPFVYATEIYPEVPAALVLVAALLLLEAGGPAAGDAARAADGSCHLPFVAAPRDPGGSPSRRREVARARVLALLLAALLWLGIKYAPLAGVVAAATFLRAGREGRWALAGAGVLLAVPYVLFHLRVFGALTPYSVNVVYAGDSTPEVLRAHVTDLANRFYRLWGLFVDRRFGLARWAPVLLLALPGMVLMARRKGAPRLALGLIAAQHLMAVFVAITMMGWWFPGRTVMTVLPLYALPLALVLQRGGRGARSAFFLLAGLSVAVTAALVRAVNLRQVTVAVDPFAMPVGWFQAMGLLFPDYRSWAGSTPWLTGLWLAVLLALGSWGWRLDGMDWRGRLDRRDRLAGGQALLK
ncbi:hypothetical protein DYI95_002230 [Thermaerobacter sp. PB12/4term]|uniref:hypothetical protein n=1 Tax=Thermaerobacter sp. PB12/4term TaxID=2293838 RepID=UPI000E32A94E|nr:hypothetical protein [Thermaerobacter sp. PB12/4term]QIA26511.1 hypothetical protein DYI95_002230 [Thermaerobacter sp. PB12/4term]